METWRRMHPDWDYRLWTEANLPRDFTNQHLIDEEQSYPAMSDYIRYELLFRFGGVYIDADSYCLRPIDDLHRLDAFAVCEDEATSPWICNGVLECEEGMN